MRDPPRPRCSARAATRARAAQRASRSGAAIRVAAEQLVCLGGKGYEGGACAFRQHLAAASGRTVIGAPARLPARRGALRGADGRRAGVGAVDQRDAAMFARVAIVGPRTLELSVAAAGLDVRAYPSEMSRKAARLPARARLPEQLAGSGAVGSFHRGVARSATLVRAPVVSVAAVRVGARLAGVEQHDACCDGQQRQAPR